MTRSLSKRIRDALRADPRSRSLRPRDGAVVNSITGGHKAAFVEFARGIDVELWLDRYTGLDTPRVWVGFHSASPSKIQRVITLAPSANLNEKPIKRSTRDIQKKGGITQFRSPLLANEFDTQIFESYGNEFFLGMYMPYHWPLSRRNQRAVVSDATNYIGSLAAAWQSLPPNGIRKVGPWNRPDRATEAKACTLRQCKASPGGIQGSEQRKRGVRL